MSAYFPIPWLITTKLVWKTILSHGDSDFYFIDSKQLILQGDVQK